MSSTLAKLACNQKYYKLLHKKRYEKQFKIIPDAFKTLEAHISTKTKIILIIHSKHSLDVDMLHMSICFIFTVLQIALSSLAKFLRHLIANIY